MLLETLKKILLFILLFIYYLFRNYLESTLKLSKLSRLLGIWSLCAVFIVLMTKL